MELAPYDVAWLLSIQHFMKKCDMPVSESRAMMCEEIRGSILMIPHACAAAQHL